MTASLLQEKDVKARLLDFLVQEEHGDVVFATEVPFADAARRADLLRVNGKITAYEIKSDVDTTRNLSSQIEDYRQCFDEVYTVTTNVHVKSLKSSLPRTVGIILVSDHSTKIIRKAKARARLNKELLASFLCRKSLVSLLQENICRQELRSLSVHDLRRCVADNASVKALRDCSLQVLKERYKSGHDYFVRNRGEKTHSEDLLHLTLRENSV